MIESSNESLRVLYQLIQALLRKEAFEEVDNFLKNFNTKISSPEIMLGILRYSYAKKEHLFQWDTFLNRVELELGNRRLNTKELLQGLL